MGKRVEIVARCRDILAGVEALLAVEMASSVVCKVQVGYQEVALRMTLLVDLEAHRVAGWLQLLLERLDYFALELGVGFQGCWVSLVEAVTLIKNRYYGSTRH